MNKYSHKKYPFNGRFYYLVFEYFDPIYGKKEDDWYSRKELVVETDNIFEYIGWITFCFPVGTKSFWPYDITESRFNELLAEGIERG